jgi:uncharacterized protein (TIGR03382 family)
VNRAGVVLGLGAVAFGVTLAVYVGSHLSREAMAVLIGAACGVGIMLPAAILAGLALLRRRGCEDMTTHAASPPQAMYPPIIVVAPPAVNPPQPGSSLSSLPPVASPRQFTVIGEDSLDAGDQ